MAFTTTLSRYELIERPAAAPTGTNVGKVGDLQQFDVVNSLNGDVIVASSLTPRSSAITALNTASVAATAIIRYVNSGGSVVYERTLATAN
jgi:hypothetical protein